MLSQKGHRSLHVLEYVFPKLVRGCGALKGSLDTVGSTGFQAPSVAQNTAGAFLFSLAMYERMLLCFLESN